MTTVQYDLYEDHKQNSESFSQLLKELEPMSEEKEHHISGVIGLPRGEKMARGPVLQHKWSVDGKAIDGKFPTPF